MKAHPHYSSLMNRHPAWYIKCSKLSRWFSVLAVMAFMNGAMAALPTPSTQVGDTVTSPTTGANSQVVQLFTGANGAVDYVLTADGKLLFTHNVVGNTFKPTGSAITYKVISVDMVVTSAGPPVVYSPTLIANVNYRDETLASGATAALSPETNASQALIDAAAANAPTSGAGAITPPTTAAGVINEVYKGASGGNGGDAYGVSIWTPWGNVTIAKTGSDGSPGADGPTVDRTVLASHGEISSVTLNTSGIKVGSIGGDGGVGGDSYGNIPAYRGGAAGNGGRNARA